MEIVNIQLAGIEDKYQQYNEQDLSLISSATISTPFGLPTDYIEYFIYDSNGSMLASNYFANNYSPVNVNSENGTYTSINLDPLGDATLEGFDRGTVSVTYNFFRKLFRSSITNTFWIKEISSDRTELRVCRQDISNAELQQAFNEYSVQSSFKAYYPDFYLNFGNNNIVIGVNVLYAVQDDEGCLLLKLYEPLDDAIVVKDTFWIVEKLGDSPTYTVDIQVPAEVTTAISNLRGPNFNIDLAQRISQTTPLYNYTSLFSTADVSASIFRQIKSLMEEKGLDINVDYSNFSNFIHYSSAVDRIYNFKTKLEQIESYQADIAALDNVALNNIGITSGSRVVLQKKIDTIIEKFDGYEYYLYFESSSTCWPKSGSDIPYIPYSVTSSQAISWLGSIDTEPTNATTSILYTAYLYDLANKDALFYLAPDYIKEDPDNLPYNTFLNMVGQHFDNIWIYYKDVTERYDADNRLDFGISKDLVGDALKSLGTKLYTNTSISDNIYYSLLGIGPDGALIPPIGDELIDYYIPFVAQGLYVKAGYVFTDYVDSILTGRTIPGEDVTKEYYKRLYHNLPYLYKTKGTARGLRALINCFGIPDTILRINEFGGSDKLQTTPDLMQRRHSLAYYNSGSTCVAFPWVGQNYYYVSASVKDVVPDTIEFRFKTAGIPDLQHTSQSLFQIGADLDTQLGVCLWYDTDLAVPSSSYDHYGQINLVLNEKGNLNPTRSAAIALPFFDTEMWWSVMLKREVPGEQSYDRTVSNRYWIYAKGATYNEEGNARIGFEGSQSLYIDGGVTPEYNDSWNLYDTTSLAANFIAYLGGTGSNGILGPNKSEFQGYFQEYRYWATPLSESVFNEHVINSTSYRGNALTASFYDLTFRAPLGSNLNVPYLSGSGTKLNDKDYDLYELGITEIDPTSGSAITSYHPAITGAFVLPFNNQVSRGIPSFISNTTTYSYGIFGANNERYFTPFEVYDLIPTPSTGVNQLVNNKVSIVDQDELPETLLSPFVSLQKYNPDISKNSPDIEVGFSPSDVLDLDISNELGYFNIDDYIGNPTDLYSTSYTSLDALRSTYFQKYTPQYTYWTSKYNVWDFIRLIKFYDNSLFKMIKDFVPARANVSTGIIVKPHILERSKYPRHEPIASTGDSYSASINMVTITGSNPEDLPASRLNTRFTQSVVTPLGTVVRLQNDLREPFTGDFNGTTIQASTNYFPQIEVSSIRSPWTSSISTGLAIYTTYSIDPLENNASASRRSSRFLTADYSSNINTPVNLGLITGALALYEIRSLDPGSTILSSPYWPFSDINDYNYQIYSRVNPRYSGTRLSGLLYSTYSAAIGNYAGDVSYGKTAVIDKLKYKYAYLVNVYVASTVLPGRSNAQIKYLIDNDENTIDLTRANVNIFDVQNIYKSGEVAQIALFDYDPNNPDVQVLTDNKTLSIYEGGFRYLPILHNLSGSATQQIFTLTTPLSITVPTGTSPSGDEFDPNNYSVVITVTGTSTDGGLTYTNVRFRAQVSYNGPSPVSQRTQVDFTYSLTVQGSVIRTGASSAIIQSGQYLSSQVALYFYGTYGGPIGDLDGTGAVTTISAAGASATGSTATYYTSFVTSSQPCIYVLTGSNQLVLNSTIAQYYTVPGLTFNSTSDPAWSVDALDTVVLPFTLGLGDRICIYDSASRLGWNENSEYVVKSASVTGSGTGSRLLVDIDRPVNTALLTQTSGSGLDSFTQANFKACRYVIFKHLPDETNLILRYAPNYQVTQDGLVYPQYLDEGVKASSGNVLQSLKSNNLIN